MLSNQLRRALFLVAVSATACTPGGYPKDWSRPKAGLFSNLIGDGCPDVRGTWDIQVTQRPDGSSTDGVWPLFGVVDRKNVRRFETLTIRGDSRNELNLRLERSFASVLAEVERQNNVTNVSADSLQRRFLDRMDPAVRTAPPFDSMTDDEYAADLAEKFPYFQAQVLELKAIRGKEYICESGWLIELYSNEISSARETKYRIGINRDGDLIRKGERFDESYFSFWCGDHCDNSIRLPDIHKQWWQRVRLAAPTKEASLPWRVAFKLARKPPPEEKKNDPPAVILSQDEFRHLMAPHLAVGTVLIAALPSGSTWTIRIQAQDEGLISQVLMSLAQDPKIYRSELLDIKKSTSVLATINVKPK